MDLNRDFTSNKSTSENMNDTKKYFIKYNFKLSFENHRKLVFTRGNILRTMITFNPFRWKSDISIYFSDSQENNIKLRAIIKTTNQIVREEEWQLWNNFIENYKNSLLNNLNLTKQNKQMLRNTILNNYRLLLIGIFILSSESYYFYTYTEFNFETTINILFKGNLFLYFLYNIIKYLYLDFIYMHVGTNSSSNIKSKK